MTCWRIDFSSGPCAARGLGSRVLPVGRSFGHERPVERFGVVEPRDRDAVLPLVEVQALRVEARLDEPLAADRLIVRVEPVDDDGAVARGARLRAFAAKHGLTIVTCRS